MEGDDYSCYSDKDVVLDAGVLKEIGRIYADGLDIKDYRCSPLYGDLNVIGNIAVFTGTRDMLNIQSRKLRDKLIQNGYKMCFLRIRKHAAYLDAAACPRGTGCGC